MIPQFFKFLAIGAINSLVGLAIIAAAMYFFDMDPMVANAVGYLVGFIVSFTLNGKLTFRQDALSMSMFARFAVVSVVAYMANIAALWIWLGHDKYVAQLFGMIVYLLVSFSGSRMFAFRRCARNSKVRGTIGIAEITYPPPALGKKVNGKSEE